MFDSSCRCGAAIMMNQFKKINAKNFGESKKVCIFAHRFGNESLMVDVAQLVRVEDCGS